MSLDLVLPVALFGWFALGSIFYYAGHALYDLTHPEMKHQEQSDSFQEDSK
jgi:hypothetical protein